MTTSFSKATRNTKRNVTIAACISLCGAIAVAAPVLAAPAAKRAAQPVSGMNLLRQMMRANRTATFSGVETMSRSGAPTVSMRVWQQGVKRRIEWLAPPIRRGDVLLDDGTNVWLYHNRDRAAVQTKSMRGARADAERMPSGLQARVTGTAIVAGRRARIVEVSRGAAKNNSQNRVLRRFWIDAATGVRLRVERFAPDGSRSEAHALQSVRFAPIAAARFAWTPPAGTSVTRTSGTLWSQLAPAKRAASWLQSPTWTPSGYGFESAVVDNARGEAWLRFSNGTRRYSIFQQRATEQGGDAPLQKVAQGWYWRRGGSRLLAVGIPNTFAARVAQSVR